MAAKLRYAVYHQNNGIMLGVRSVDGEKEVIWSKVTAGLDGTERAPTFTDRASVEEYLNEHGVLDGFPSDYELWQVHSRRENYSVGVEECADALLPRWGER